MRYRFSPRPGRHLSALASFGGVATERARRAMTGPKKVTEPGDDTGAGGEEREAPTS
jgi:hypothetical protein